MDEINDYKKLLVCVCRVETKFVSGFFFGGEIVYYIHGTPRPSP